MQPAAGDHERDEYRRERIEPQQFRADTTQPIRPAQTSPPQPGPHRDTDPRSGDRADAAQAPPAARLDPAGREAIEPVTAPPYPTQAGPLEHEAETFRSSPSSAPPAEPTAEPALSWADSVWARSATPEAPAEPETEQVEPAAAPAEPEPADAEPHGLGWLLSESGLGATTPLPPEPEPEPEPAPEPSAGPEPEPEPPVVVDEDVRPVSAPFSKQNWFSPVSAIPVDSTTAYSGGSTGRDRDTDPAFPLTPTHEAEPIKADLHDARPINAEPINAEPINAEPINAEPINAEPVEAEWHDAELVDPEPVDAEFHDAELVDAEPADAALHDAEPLDAEPVEAEVHDAGPFDAEVHDAGPVDGELFGAGLFDGQLVDGELLDAELVDAELVDAELVDTVDGPAGEAATWVAAPAQPEASIADPFEDEIHDAILVDHEPFDDTDTDTASRTSLVAAIEAPPRLPALPAEQQADGLAGDEPLAAEYTHPRTEPEPRQPEAAAPESAAQPEPTEPEPDESELEEWELDEPGQPVTGQTETDHERAGADYAEADQVHRDRPGPGPAPAAEDAPIASDSSGGLVHAPIRQRRDQVAGPSNRRADPEQVLTSYPWAFDPETLREQIDDTDPMWVVFDRLTDKLEFAERDAIRARLLSLRAVAQRLLGELDAALTDARAALAHALKAGELRQTATVRARLAHVLQWRGEYAEADRLFAEAESPELPARLRAEIHELAGRSAFEQGRYLESVNHLDRALDLRKGADPELVERIELTLDTITRHTGGGWGPYPRTREEILGKAEGPAPLWDEGSGLWGYAGAVPPRYAQAQPFANGLAWVRRPESPAWELIDEAGGMILDASPGYRAAGPFAEGLAWVSRDEAGGWHAIDRQNRVIVPGGFDDAKPFHNGVALILRGGWGAVDRHGRTVVQPRYRGFATEIVDGGAVDGFTEEGLAVVDAGERYGVIDRSGQLVVAPVHTTVVIHPSAFLIADKYALWGALDRQGEPLIEMKYRDRKDVLNEIDRLLPDARPVL